MKRSKYTLILYIILELLITVGCLVNKNYIAAVGWGFLMLTNAGLLQEQIDKEEKK